MLRYEYMIRVNVPLFSLPFQNKKYFTLLLNFCFKYNTYEQYTTRTQKIDNDRTTYISLLK